MCRSRALFPVISEARYGRVNSAVLHPALCELQCLRPTPHLAVSTALGLGLLLSGVYDVLGREFGAVTSGGLK